MTGKTGTGKSSLVNAVIGSSTDGAEEGKDLGGTTKVVTGYSATIGGVQFKIWDAPGIQDAKHDDEEILDIIRKSLSESEVSSVHLVLYCIRMDQDRIDRAEINGINLLCRLFNKEIWNHSVFALTFANRVLPPPEKDGDDDAAEQWFEDRIKEFENRIHETLVESGVSKDIAKKVKALPTGYHKRTRRIQEPKKIIGKQDWLSPFWCSCAEHLKEEALVSLFISQTPRINPNQDLVEDTSPKEENDPVSLNSKLTLNFILLSFVVATKYS